jgi:16S rRNA (guanine527-N7)-methyltransferase
MTQQGIVASDTQVEQLAAYHQTLVTWNQRLNLTRHADLETFVIRDLWDTWQLAQHLATGERVLDVGTGGGVPGIPLAILRPDLQVSLCESVGKKAEAVAEIVAELRLPVTVYGARAEDLLPVHPFGTLVARAVGPMWKILKWVQPHWEHFERLVLIKGPKWPEERGEARHRGYLHGLALRRLASYATPGHYGESVVLTIYPRPDDETELDDSDEQSLGHAMQLPAESGTPAFRAASQTGGPGRARPKSTSRPKPPQGRPRSTGNQTRRGNR